jgi:hypothetical protein
LVLKTVGAESSSLFRSAKIRAGQARSNSTPDQGDTQMHNRSSALLQASEAAKPPATTSSKYPAHLEALFEKINPVKPRLIFAIDATASRQPTWELAAKLTSQMFQAVAGSGGLELQLVYYRGERECTASRWMSDAHALSAAMSRVMCAAGHTRSGASWRMSKSKINATRSPDAS